MCVILLKHYKKYSLFVSSSYYRIVPNEILMSYTYFHALILCTIQRFDNTWFDKFRQYGRRLSNTAVTAQIIATTNLH